MPMQEGVMAQRCRILDRVSTYQDVVIRRVRGGYVRHMTEQKEKAIDLARGGTPSGVDVRQLPRKLVPARSRDR
jgi:hypothetical protein